jgi:hypothetical protein
VKRPLRTGLLAAGGLAIAIQLVPYGRDHADPAGAWPTLGDARAEELFRDACADCHSNETVWPWYSNVAPMSWLVQRDVELGRDEWNAADPDVEWDEGAEETAEGEMPPRQYTILHAGARLSADERALLADALEAMERSSR